MKHLFIINYPKFRINENPFGKSTKFIFTLNSIIYL